MRLQKNQINKKSNIKKKERKMTNISNGYSGKEERIIRKGKRKVRKRIRGREVNK